MIAAAYRDPNGTIAVQARLGGALTLIPDPIEWAGIAAATGVQTFDATVNDLVAKFGQVPHPLYDDGRDPIRILAPDNGGASRYGAIGNRAWPITNTTDLALLEKTGAEVVTLPQASIDAIIIH
jgi:hypothetical protein